MYFLKSHSSENLYKICGSPVQWHDLINPYVDVVYIFMIQRSGKTIKVHSTYDFTDALRDQSFVRTAFQWRQHEMKHFAAL